MSTFPSPLPIPPPPKHLSSPPPPLTVILTIVIIVCFFVGFFTIYFFKCFLHTMMQSWRLRHGGAVNESNTENPHQPPEAPPANPGLDPRIINSFPTFLYSTVKDLREENYGLECAICLLEFDDDHVLRLLTTCYHVFHQECIDLWFERHRSCPVCRRDLDPPPPPENNNNVLPNVDEMIIDVIQEPSDEEEEEEEEEEDNNHHHQTAIATTTPIDTWPSSGQGSCIEKEQTLPEKFSRSKSTGHSIVRNKPEEEDKFTLRLPKNVKVKFNRGHNQTESCVSFAELAKHKGNYHRRFGEVSGQSSQSRN